MNARWLGVFGCLLLFAVASQAADTVQTFDGGGTPYAETMLGALPGATATGPSGMCYRITSADNSCLNTIMFDRTQVGAVSHVVADFDFRIGGSTDGRTHGADGIGFVLLNTGAVINSGGDTYGTITDGPQITEDAVALQSIGIGFDTWHNNPPLDPNDNHVSVNYSNCFYRDTVPDFETVGLGCFHAAQSLYPFGYRLHRNDLPDNAPFDHATITIDAVTGGANVSVTITPAGKAAFTPLNNIFIPGFVPYEMRAAFGARTGGENDNHDIDNVKITYAP